jgi:hypothetical protein
MGPAARVARGVRRLVVFFAAIVVSPSSRVRDDIAVA